MFPFSSGSDLTLLGSDGGDHRLMTFIAAAEQLGSDGKGKLGLVGYMMFIANEDPVQFAIWLNKVHRAELRPRRDRPRPSPDVQYTVVSDAIIKAAEQLGSDGKGRNGADGFLATYARKHPRQFSELLDSVLDAECARGGPIERRRIEMTFDRKMDAIRARSAIEEDGEEDQAE
jgi:hypothetical protein